MNIIQEGIEVDVPASTAYRAWTRCETFPAFMPNVEEVRRIDDQHLYWRVNVMGRQEAWTAEITEQIPDKRIAWTSKVSTDGAHNSGVVTFHTLDDDRARVMVQLGYEPSGVVEKLGTAVGVLNATLKVDLKRFKDFVERSPGDLEGRRVELPPPADTGLPSPAL